MVYLKRRKKNSLGVMSYLSIMVLKEWESVKVSMQIYTPRNPGILEQCQGLGMWLFFEKNRSIYYILNTVLWQGFYICSIEALEKFIWIIQFIMCPQTFVTLIKEVQIVQIVYRLFLVNCNLLHVPRLPSQPASNLGVWVIDWTGLNWLDST